MIDQSYEAASRKELAPTLNNLSVWEVIEIGELQICLLGSFQVCWEFVPVSNSMWRMPKAVKLLKMVLSSRPDPLPAEEAIRRLGGGITLFDLPSVMQQVCKVLEPAASLQFDQEGRICFLHGADCWIDVDALMAHYEAGMTRLSRGEMLPAMLSLQEADALYQGEFLEEVQEPWVIPVRLRIRHLYTDILERLADGHAVLSRYQDAVGFCHKALAHDPRRESNYQRLMVYYYYLGDLTAVEEAFQACQEAFQSNGMSLSQETVTLRERLTHQGVRVDAGQAAIAVMDETGKIEK